MSLADRRRVGKQGRSAPQADLRSNSEKRSFKTGFPEQTGVGLKKMCRKKVQIAVNRESRARRHDGRLPSLTLLCALRVLCSKNLYPI